MSQNKWFNFIYWILILNVFLLLLIVYSDAEDRKANQPAQEDKKGDEQADSGVESPNPAKEPEPKLAPKQKADAATDTVMDATDADKPGSGDSAGDQDQSESINNVKQESAAAKGESQWLPRHSGLLYSRNSE